ncbi:hypothetical protein [Ferrovibrio sp.]|uniref:hypothetical protein n=1 Tax=Ferrovibrio sp. TaxID=1917215 RepID=UPI003D0F71A8
MTFSRRARRAPQIAEAAAPRLDKRKLAIAGAEATANELRNTARIRRQEGEADEAAMLEGEAKTHDLIASQLREKRIGYRQRQHAGYVAKALRA